jgi:hypothetical protein
MVIAAVCLATPVARAARVQPGETASLSLTADPCQPISSEGACNGKDECVWCKAAAVPSSCFTLVSARAGQLCEDVTQGHLSMAPVCVCVCLRQPTRLVCLPAATHPPCAGASGQAATGCVCVRPEGPNNSGHAAQAPEDAALNRAAAGRGAHHRCKLLPPRLFTQERLCCCCCMLGTSCACSARVTIGVTCPHNVLPRQAPCTGHQFTPPLKVKRHSITAAAHPSARASAASLSRHHSHHQRTPRHLDCGFVAMTTSPLLLPSPTIVWHASRQVLGFCVCVYVCV